MKRTGLLFLMFLMLNAVQAQTVYFHETFDNAIADGWTIEVVSGDTIIDNWRFDNLGNRVFGKTISDWPAAIFDDAYATSIAADPDTVDLISPPTNMSGRNNSSLFFYEYFEGGFNGKGEVYARGNATDTWTLIYTVEETSIANPDKIGIDLQPILKSIAKPTDFQLKFRWIGDGSFWWIVDDIMIYSSVQSDAVGVKAENLPQGCVVTYENPIAFTVKNTGTNQLGSMTFNYQVNNGEVVSEPVSFPVNLGQTEMYTHTFVSVPVFKAGDNEIKLWPSDPNGNADPFPSNDTTYNSTYLTKLQVINIPFVETFEDTLIDDAFCLNYGASNNGRIYIADTSNNITPVSGNLSLAFDSENFGSTIDGLDLLVNLSSCVDKILSFKYMHVNEEADPEDGLFLSVDNGGVFVKIFDFDFGNIASETVVEVNLNLDSIAEANGITLTEASLLRWKHAGNNSIEGGDDGFLLDDISIDILNRQVVDATITAMVKPEPIIYKDSIFKVSVYIKNNENAVDTLVAARIGYQYNNGAIINEFWGGCLPPGDSALFTFSNEFYSGMNEGVYDLISWIKMPESENMLDFELMNDTLKTQVEVKCSPLTAEFDVINNCFGQTTEFLGTSPYATSWAWEFGDGAGVADSINPAYDFAAMDTYAVKLKTMDAKGCVDSLVQNVEILATPKAGFSVNPVCLNTEIVIVDSAENAVEWAYNFGDGAGTSNLQTPEYVYTAPGTYAIDQVVTAENGCSSTATANVEIYELPSPNAGIDTSINCNDTIILRSTVINGVAPYTYYWNNGTTADTNQIYAGGNYNLIVTDANNCVNNDTVVVALNSTFTLNLSADTTVCYGTTTDVVATAAGGLAPYAYLWNTGATNSSITAAANDIPYSVSVKDDLGCELIDFMKVMQNDSLTVALPDDFSICFQVSSTVISTVEGGDGNFSYLWNTTETTESILVNTSGNYSLEVTDGIGCVAGDEVIVAVNPELIAQLPADTLVCKGDEIEISVQTTGGDGNYVYNWNTGETTETIMAGSGTYFVDVFDGLECIATDTMLIKPGVTADAGYTKLVHCNETTSLIAKATNGTGNYTYLWSTGETTDTINNVWPGTYKVTITDDSGCSDIDSVLVILFETDFTISVNADTTICEGDTALLYVKATGGTLPYSYLWSTTDTVPDFYTLQQGVYSVTVTDSAMCRLSKETRVSFSPIKADFVPSATVVYLDKATEVQFTNTSVNAETYAWDFGNGTTSDLAEPTVTYTQMGDKNVELIAFDKNMCSDTTMQTIEVFEFSSVNGSKSLFVNMYPNPATTEFTIDFSELKGEQILLEIYDIDGKKIMQESIHLEANDFVKTYDANSMKQGIYLVKITVDNQSETKRLIIN